MSTVEDLFGIEHRDKRGVSSHETAANSTDEWLTPPALIAALGSFDLDPCSPGDRRPWDTAAKHYSLEDDGLRQEWSGRVLVEPALRLRRAMDGPARRTR